MGSTTAREIIRNLAHWHVHEPKTEDVIPAIDLQQKFQVSFWDAMILQSALQLDNNLIWSEDLKPGQFYNHIRLINPFE